MTDGVLTAEARQKIHRYTITSEGASLGYFRLVEDANGAWVTWAEVEALLSRWRSAHGSRDAGGSNGM